MSKLKSSKPRRRGKLRSGKIDDAEVGENVLEKAKPQPARRRIPESKQATAKPANPPHSSRPPLRDLASLVELNQQIADNAIHDALMKVRQTYERQSKLGGQTRAAVLTQHEELTKGISAQLEAIRVTVAAGTKLNPGDKLLKE